MEIEKAEHLDKYLRVEAVKQAVEIFKKYNDTNMVLLSAKKIKHYFDTGKLH